MEQNFDEPRYLAQLQSLLVGEFLIPPASPYIGNGAVPMAKLETIQECFVPAPLRYRLTRAQALANYKKAEGLCREAIAQHPRAPNLWEVRNRRIVALLGMWKLDFEPKHLQAAASESRAALAAPPPAGAEVVPRFCLAKEAFRLGDRSPRLVLAELLDASSTATERASAAILAMDVNASELHASARERFLAAYDGDPSMWPVVSFLQDQNHRYRLFTYNYYMPASRARRIIRAQLRSNTANLDAPADSSGALQAEFAKLDGGNLKLPHATDGKLTLLMFVEPPADTEAEFPILINGAISEDAKGKKTETLGVMQHAFQYAEQHVEKEIKVIAAFISDDTDRVKSMMEKNDWPCQAVTVPGGLANPVLRQLGVLSADRVPNIVLLRPDGTIAWRLSGLVHPQVRSEGVSETLHGISRGMKHNIDRYEIERSVSALEKGDHAGALRLFSGPFPIPERPSPDGWTPPRFHGRAIANVKLKNWEAALADLDAAIQAHEWEYNQKKPCPCHRVADLLLTKANVLDELGRAPEAKEARQRARTAKFKHSESRYGRLHDRIRATKGAEKN